MEDEDIAETAAAAAVAGSTMDTVRTGDWNNGDSIWDNEGNETLDNGKDIVCNKDDGMDNDENGVVAGM